MSNSRVLLVLASVFLASLLGLMLQIALTRVFSATIWYQYTFVAISIALFGWGLGGLVLHFFRQKIQGKELTFIAACLFLLSVFMPVYVMILLRIPAYPSSITAYFLVSLVPFFVAGICLALLYNQFAASASRIYFADLAGASVACLAAEPILACIGAEPTILLLGIVAAVPSFLIALFTKRRVLIAMSLIGIVTVSTIFAADLQNPFLTITDAPTKEMFRELKGNNNLKIAITRWNSFSRVDAVEGYGGDILARIYIDADASTEVLRWNGTKEDLQRFNNTMDVLPYRLVQNPNALIIGPGGGKDVLYALEGGSSNITGVELNPIIVDIVKGYGGRAGNIYDGLPNVNVLVDEGRSFISRSNEKYDVITLTLVDSWAAISAGGYALAENYLYTKEAFIDYVNHLTDAGLLMMIRWQNEIPRLVATCVEASMALGENASSVGKRIAIVTQELEPGKVSALLMLKKEPFTLAEAENLANQVAAAEPHCTAFYIPYVNDTTEPYHSLFNGSITLDQYYAQFPERVSAVSDDSPYYFDFDPGIPKTLSDLTTLALLLSLGFIAVPLTGSLVWQRRKSSHATKFNNIWLLFILYFSALGIGYMLIEVALIQKFILFLGYPTRALAVSLFSLLLSSGIGAVVSGRLARGNRGLVRNILVACPLIAGCLIVYIMFAPPLLTLLLPQNAPVRIVVTIFLLFPLGFLMGIPFPSGLRLLNAEANQNVPWMWGVNGATSVLGSVLATLGGILLGFRYVMVFGIIAYLIAFASALGCRRKLTSSS